MATHFLGIRHHGAGSAARVVRALEALKPDCVLIEGPADCDGLLPLLAQQEMRPPVALLAYAADAPEHHLYYPFAQFSPEYQAICWAVENGAAVHFIDIPVNIQLAGALEKAAQEVQEAEAAENPPSAEGADVQNAQDAENAENPPSTEGADVQNEQDAENVENPHNLHSDPIGTMAKLAGYQDGESWWNDFLEQNHDNSEELFATIANLMTELRAAFPDTPNPNESFADSNLAREAFMRLNIAAAEKKAATVVVICGAWHVPALQEKIALKADRDTIKALPKKLPASKIKTTWIPWTSTRLSQSSGYGAGVPAPMWYQHLWETRASKQAQELWLGKMAAALRQEGHIVSTASIIEAVRLAHSLAAVRARPAAGFEELTDAIIACLCFGEKLLWESLAPRLLLGDVVGAIPPDTPLAPLLEDLQRQQKACKLKPEALARELSLDLRSDSGGRRSLLLHRLIILGVPWGELQHAGGSRGTFREKWLLEWHPEYSVQLVENLVYGNTIEQAASGKTIEKMQQNPPLKDLAELVESALIADLPLAAEKGLALLDVQASQSDNAAVLMTIIVPLIQVSRYGTARNIDLSYLQSLIERLTVQTALTLPYACRHLNNDEAQTYQNALTHCHSAILLADLPPDVLRTWWAALAEIVDNPSSNLLLSGLATRLLYQAEHLDEECLQLHLARTLSPAVPALDAAQYFAGFFTGIAQQLLHHDTLRLALDSWMISLTEDDFITHLPLFKRVFADLDRTEKQRLLQKILNKAARTAVIYQPLGQSFSPEQMALLMELFCE